MKSHALLSVKPWSWKFWLVSIVAVILLSCSLTIIHIGYNITTAALEPCGTLDALLKRSNCLQILRYSYNVSHILDITFSPDGQWVAASGTADIPKVWHTANGELLSKLNSQATGIFGNFQFSPTGQTIVFAQYYMSNTLTLADPVSAAILFQLKDMPPINDIAYSPDGTILAIAATGSDTVEFRQVPNGLLLNSLTIGDLVVEEIVFSPDGEKLLAVVDNEFDKALYSWQIDDGIQVDRFPLNVQKNMGIAFSTDRTLLALGNCVQMGEINCANAEVTLWQISDGRLLHKLDVPGDYVNDLAFSADGTLLAISSHNVDAQGFIQLWSVQDGDLLDTLEEFNDRHNQVAFSPDGEVLAIGSKDVILWKIK